MLALPVNLVQNQPVPLHPTRTRGQHQPAVCHSASRTTRPASHQLRKFLLQLRSEGLDRDVKRVPTRFHLRELDPQGLVLLAVARRDQDTTHCERWRTPNAPLCAPPPPPHSRVPRRYQPRVCSLASGHGCRAGTKLIAQLWRCPRPRPTSPSSLSALMSGLRVSAPVASLAPMDIGHLACQRESAHGEQLVVSAYTHELKKRRRLPST